MGKMKRDSWVGVFAALTFTFLTTQLGAAETMAQLRGSGARIALDSKTNVARFIGFDAVNVAGHAALGGATASAALQGMPVETTAAQHLVNFGGLFGLRDTAQEARVSKQREGRDGRSMVRYQQHHRGIPIIAGELIVNQNAQRQLTSISGKISPSLKLNTTPAITAEQAGVIARQAMAKWYQLPEVDFVVPTPTLSIYDSRLMSPFDDPVALVWRLDVTTNALLPINEFIAVDAASGVVALHFNQVPHAKNRLTYDANSANNTTNPTGVLVCDESSPNCLGQIQDAVSAHINAG